MRRRRWERGHSGERGGLEEEQQGEEEEEVEQQGEDEEEAEGEEQRAEELLRDEVPRWFGDKHVERKRRHLVQCLPAWLLQRASDNCVC